jgi:hypothetical protein
LQSRNTKVQKYKPDSDQEIQSQEGGSSSNDTVTSAKVFNVALIHSLAPTDRLLWVCDLQLARRCPNVIAWSAASINSQHAAGHGIYHRVASCATLERTFSCPFHGFVYAQMVQDGIDTNGSIVTSLLALIVTSLLVMHLNPALIADRQ